VEGANSIKGLRSLTYAEASTVFLAVSGISTSLSRCHRTIGGAFRNTAAVLTRSAASA
jgi:hypothetical protein